MPIRQPILPSLMISADDARRLSLLAKASMTQFPRVAHFLAQEVNRATIVPEQPKGIVRMGSQVVYRDEGTGRIRDVTLVFPHEADINLNRISVLTPVGAALIGLAKGQNIEFQTPTHEKRSLTVLVVRPD
jgi:regulator of nucleoside diphosphate kinase